MFPLKMVIFHSYVSLPEGIYYGHENQPDLDLNPCLVAITLCRRLQRRCVEASKSYGRLYRTPSTKVRQPGLKMAKWTLKQLG